MLQRIDDVSSLCDQRIATLKKMATKPTRPIQTVQPNSQQPLQPKSGAPNLRRGRKNSNTRTVSLKFINLQRKLIKRVILRHLLGKENFYHIEFYRLSILFHYF